MLVPVLPKLNINAIEKYQTISVLQIPAQLQVHVHVYYSG